MSAETLREAAALMRERAEEAARGPWAADVRSDGRAWVDLPGVDDHGWGMHGWGPEALHVASWHPAVALAVADWLDAVAAKYEETVRMGLGATAHGIHYYREALAVARAYLGRSS